jgi:hypothetical protein
MTFGSTDRLPEPGRDEYEELVREFAHALKVYEANVKDAEYGGIFAENRRPYRFRGSDSS